LSMARACLVLALPIPRPSVQMAEADSCPASNGWGLPDLNMNDSSVGSGGGARKGRYSTAMPSFLALASSWNTSLARDFGALVGRELADQGYNISLGGGVDIAREARQWP
jgi:beta-glucosidase